MILAGSLGQSQPLNVRYRSGQRDRWGYNEELNEETGGCRNNKCTLWPVGGLCVGEQRCRAVIVNNRPRYSSPRLEMMAGETGQRDSGEEGGGRLQIKVFPE
ncbi:hypothetical protein PoB_002621700 [Plakobranchus ocellatus]|uniref:Uncharacterized protein n=1 Tax=Plakobranchus ocellatus TaxID=259542 RepID=A0AAV3ZYS1_9GAST|nr:hypothetical protein PoB_002621700 [Plakobranchus ocellatus]